MARLIAFAASEHEDVQKEGLGHSVRFADTPTRHVEASERVTVIDGGSLQTSPKLLQAAENASQIIVVVMIGHDVIDAVRVARQLARN